MVSVFSDDLASACGQDGQKAESSLRYCPPHTCIFSPGPYEPTPFLMLSCTFKYSQFCAFGATVFLKFFIRWHHWFSCYNMSLRDFSAYTYRKMPGADTWILISPESIFHNPVFQRMEGNNAEPSSGLQKPDQLVQRILQNLQLLIQLNTDRLKGLLRRMPLLHSYLHRYGRFDDFNQFSGRLNRSFPPRLYNVFRYIFCIFRTD